MQLKAGAAEFFLESSGSSAVLLIHGYTGTPAEMRPLGDYLAAQGYPVLGVRLAGHGADLATLAQSTADDWYNSVARSWQRLRENYRTIYIAGLSMGGLLAIKAAAELGAAKLALLSTPIFVADKRQPFYPLLKYFLRYLPKHRRDYGDFNRYNLCNEKLPTQPLKSLFQLRDACTSIYLARLSLPTLVLQAAHDRTVLPISATYIYQHLATKPSEKKLLLFPESGHLLTLDKEHAAVFQAIAEFFAQ